MIKSQEILDEDLLASARRGETEACLQLILNGANINATNIHGSSPLLRAAYARRVETAFVLIDKGADTNARDAAGNSILHISGEWPSEDYERLMGLGLDPNTRNKSDESPLHVVNDLAKVESLLSAGADVNACAASNTPLHLALMRRNWAVSERLVRSGANTEISDYSHHTVMLAELRRGSWAGVSLLVALGVKAKPWAGKNREWRRLISMSPLHAAAAGGHTQLALRLINEGENPFLLFRRKKASEIAIETGHLELASLLQACEARCAIDMAIDAALPGNTNGRVAAKRRTKRSYGNS